MKQVQLPPEVYSLAKVFTVSVPLMDSQQRLMRFITIPMLYTLLVETVGNKSAREGDREMESIQEASQALLRFPMNLLLAPNRPEFRRLTVRVCHCVLVCLKYACNEKLVPKKL